MEAELVCVLVCMCVSVVLVFWCVGVRVRLRGTELVLGFEHLSTTWGYVKTVREREGERDRQRQRN